MLLFCYMCRVYALYKDVWHVPGFAVSTWYLKIVFTHTSFKGFVNICDVNITSTSRSAKWMI